MIGWLTRVVAGGSDREARRLSPIVEKINALEPQFEALSDDALRAKTAEFRRRLGVAEVAEVAEGPSGEGTGEGSGGGPDGGAEGRPAKVETLDDLLPEAFAAVREASRRTIGLRHFNVQLIGGMVLHQGKIAEMKTGEGKTLVASLPLYLNALLGRGAHLVTPNDYLSRVGGGWMGPVYHALGIRVGVICSFPDQFAGIYDPSFTDTVDHGDERLMHWRPVTRRDAYRADVTYGTNNEFGFDYLRDNMEMDASGLRQRPLYFAIVDEVDSILVDEARTPLIISGPAEEPPDTYYKFAQLVSRLKADEDFTVDLKMRSVLLTDEGIAKVEKLAGVDNIYGEQNYHLVHYLEQALKAMVIFRRDRDYVLYKDGRVLGGQEYAEDAEVVIVDEFTGRLMLGRRYSEGLHQSIEAKERVRVQRENLTYATITFQNYFRLYKKLAGMTGTAATEAEEFRKIYNLEVVPIPTNKPMIREDLPDLIYKNEAAKLAAIVDEIEEAHEAGRPVLVGTTSVEKSERLATMLRERSIPHQVLNAKYHEQEAAIVAQAGRKGAVTIATNMAGRGTDILLGGNPDILAYEVLERQGIKLQPEQDGSAGQDGPDGQGEGATATGAPEGDALPSPDGSQNGSAGQNSQSGTNGTHKGVVTGKAEGVRELPLPEYHLAYQAAREEAQREITEREREEILSSGGLHIIGSERHEARRIDNQLRGRAGRQGDPGSSRFYLSLDDDLMRRFGSDRIAGLMERLGLEDDQPIEHSIVSRSIEQAQQKVEGYNFDLRKHTVEYDDVMNKQREVIYGQRRKIMEAEDIRPIVLEIVRGQVERLVEQHTDSPRPDEWDLDGLYAAVTSMFGTELEHGPEELEGLSREDVTETVYGWAEELYQQKEQQYTPELMALAARGTLLRIIDGLWVEHLTAIDDMIAGIGLRAYGQRDPLTEYKGEAYRMFQTLLDAVRSNLANAIFRIQFIAQPYAQPAPGPEGAPAPPPAPPAPRAAPAAPSAPPRRLQTNRAQEEVPGASGSRPGDGRPLVQDGRALSRAERRQLEREARRQKNRTPNGGR